MARSTPTSDLSWTRLDVRSVAELFASIPERWWLSGGVALDHWLGRPVRDRMNVDVSVVASEVVHVIAGLPSTLSAWIQPEPTSGAMIAFADAPRGTDLQSVLIRDDENDAWVLQINVEDGTSDLWVYKRDPRLRMPWTRAVLQVDGIPTGAPEMQLVWKALRPRPEDDADKDAVLSRLSDDARSWYERAILTVHPHSSWSIHVRSPFAPAKASWERKR